VKLLLLPGFPHFLKMLTLKNNFWYHCYLFFNNFDMFNCTMKCTGLYVFIAVFEGIANVFASLNCSGGYEYGSAWFVLVISWHMTQWFNWSVWHAVVCSRCQ